MQSDPTPPDWLYTVIQWASAAGCLTPVCHSSGHSWSFQWPQQCQQAQTSSNCSLTFFTHDKSNRKTCGAIQLKNVCEHIKDVNCNMYGWYIWLFQLGIYYVSSCVYDLLPHRRTWPKICKAQFELLVDKLVSGSNTNLSNAKQTQSLSGQKHLFCLGEKLYFCLGFLCGKKHMGQTSLSQTVHLDFTAIYN